MATTPTAEEQPALERPAHAMKDWMGNLGGLDQEAPAKPALEAHPERGGEPAVRTAPAPKEEAVKPAPAANAPASEDDDADDSKWPRKAEDWKKFKEARKEREVKLQSRITELETAHADLQKKLPAADSMMEHEAIKKKLTDTETKLKEYDEAMRVSAVERHPNFKRYFEGKTGAAVSMAQAIVGSDNAKTIAELINLPDGALKNEKLDEFVAGLSPLNQSRLGAVLNDLEGIGKERAEAIKNASANFEKLQAQEKTAREQQIGQQRASLESALDAKIKEYSDPAKGITIFQKRDGDAAWNKEVDDRIARARSLLLDAKHTPESLTQAALYAESFPSLVRHAVESAKASEDKIATLEAQIKAMTAANPGSGQGSERTAQPGQQQRTAPKQGQRPFDTAKDWAKEMVAAQRGE